MSVITTTAVNSASRLMAGSEAFLASAIISSKTDSNFSSGLDSNPLAKRVKRTRTPAAAEDDNDEDDDPDFVDDKSDVLIAICLN